MRRAPHFCFAQFCLVMMLATGCASVRHDTGDPVYHAGTSRKMFQMTGDFDQPLRRPTASLTETRAGVNATDLCSSFEHKGVLYFLFGDCWGRDLIDYDTYATTTAKTPSDLVLSIPKAPDGKFLILKVPGIHQRGMAVASGGISLNGRIYIVHTTQWGRAKANMERSVLARSDDDGHTWERVYDLSAATNHDMTNARFINVSMAEVDARDYRGALPWRTGKVTLIWGSGAYRKSNVALAAVPSADIEDKSALRYFAGMSPKGVPKWSKAESDAAYMFEQPQIGEFSVTWIPQVSRWVMLYNAELPRGITMRTAKSPWGPWSGGQLLIDPWNDRFYGTMEHIPWGERRNDGFQDAGREKVWGGEYGPYIISRFTTGTTSACQIYYTLSTWNPYQVVVMRSEIGTPLPPETTATLASFIIPGDAKWHVSSRDFFTTMTRNGFPWMTTHTSKGDAATGCMWRWLPRDTRNTALRFAVSGGHAEVMVLSGGGEIPVEGATAESLYPRIKKGEFGEVVFCTWGHDSDRIDVNPDWDLRPFDRANLKIIVIDHLKEPWGFVAVSPMILTRTAEPTGASPDKGHR